MLLHRLIWLSLGIALLVGSLQSIVQQYGALPVILAAEKFEEEKAQPPAMSAHDQHDHSSSHEDTSQWMPKDGLERQTWTWVANILVAFGLALLILVTLAMHTVRNGSPARPLLAALAVAFGGFFCLYAWPALGMPAEIPGMDAPRLGARQTWWLLASGSAAAALILSACWKQPLRWPMAIALLALPYAVRAPELAGDPFAGLDVQAAEQMRELARKFVWISATTTLIQWIALGLLCGATFRRWLLPLLLATTLRMRVRRPTS